MDDPKELLKGIDPEKLPDDLKQLYKSMQADYTRKTTELARQQEGHNTEKQQLLDRLKNAGALEQEVTQWRNWFASLEKDKATKKDDKSVSTDIDYLKDNPEVSKIVDNFKGDIEQLKVQLSGYDSALKEQGDRFNRIVGFQSQLNDLIRENPKLDKDKLLGFAVEKHIPDLKKAYQELYHDEIVEDEVKKRVQVELLKKRTDGIMGGQYALRREASAAKTFGEATANILKEKAAAGTLG